MYHTWWNLTPVIGKPYWCSFTNVGLADLRSKVRQCAELVPTPIVSPSVSNATADTFQGFNFICIDLISIVFMHV